MTDCMFTTGKLENNGDVRVMWCDHVEYCLQGLLPCNHDVTTITPRPDQVCDENQTQTALSWESEMDSKWQEAAEAFGIHSYWVKQTSWNVHLAITGRTHNTFVPHCHEQPRHRLYHPGCIENTSNDNGFPRLSRTLSCAFSRTIHDHLCPFSIFHIFPVLFNRIDIKQVRLSHIQYVYLTPSSRLH